MANRVVTTEQFNHLLEQVMETIAAYYLPDDVTDDEYNSVDDAIQHALRDLFVFEEAK
jgi:hypothetical protein